LALLDRVAEADADAGRMLGGGEEVAEPEPAALGAGLGFGVVVVPLLLLPHAVSPAAATHVTTTTAARDRGRYGPFMIWTDLPPAPGIARSLPCFCPLKPGRPNFVGP
jgi:hypothetical protein